MIIRAVVVLNDAINLTYARSGTLQGKILRGGVARGGGGNGGGAGEFEQPGA